MEELAGDSQYSRGTTLRGAFVGWNRHSMDEKKRLTIPANWREIMGYPGYMYVMFSAQQDRLLTLIPPIEMEEKIKQLREGLRGNPGYKTALKFISENSEQVFFDAQGRIRIPRAGYGGRDRLGGEGVSASGGDGDARGRAGQRGGDYG